MADELDENTESEQSTVVPHKKKILILLLPIFLVVGSVVGVYFSGLADSFIGSATPNEKSAEDILRDADGIAAKKRPVFGAVDDGEGDRSEAERELLKALQSMR